MTDRLKGPCPDSAHIGHFSSSLMHPNWKLGTLPKLGNVNRMANHIKRLRLERGLTQPQLAALMGTTKNQLIKLESGNRRLHQGWIERAAKALDVPNSDIIDDVPAQAAESQEPRPGPPVAIREASAADIGRRLKATREALGLSIEVISNISGISSTQWSAYEQGKARIDIDSALRLAKTTGAPLDWIYLGDETLLPARIALSLRNED